MCIYIYRERERYRYDMYISIYIYQYTEVHWFREATHPTEEFAESCQAMFLAMFPRLII